MEKYYNLLEFNKIRAQLAELAMSEPAKNKALTLCPATEADEAVIRMTETGEAKKIIESCGQPPVSAMRGVLVNLELAEKGAMLAPDQLCELAGFLLNCAKMKKYLAKAQDNFIGLAFIGNTLNPLEYIANEIHDAVRDTGMESYGGSINAAINDSASPELREIRKKLTIASEKIKEKLNSMLRGNKSWFADTFIATRNGRLTLPVKREHKNRVPGIVIDTSQTGSTCFIEPEQARKIRDEMYSLEIQEENEIRRILYKLSAMAAADAQAIRTNAEAMETLDFIFAKAKLSLRMNAGCVHIVSAGDDAVVIKSGRHPLLPREAVPLDFEIGGGIRSVVITGPNMGGKTVALKTVGLLTLMAQSGLHVPADTESRFSMRDMVLCDIGDGQSIMESLSTFSAHITNIIEILAVATPLSLVLLDELGSGTDPAEGMGLAIAILEALAVTGCLCVATTHYPEIKTFAKTAKGFINARMAFDGDSLRPLYALIIGEAGESCALHIAQKLGMPQDVLDRASSLAQGAVAVSEISTIEKILAKTAAESYFTAKESKPVTAGRTDNTEPKHRDRFKPGDSVIVYPTRDIGIVCSRADAKGMISVIVKGGKVLINHKRLKLKVAAAELYPDDYDFSIIFDSVAVRKAHKAMIKGRGEGIVIDCDSGSVSKQQTFESKTPR